MTQRIQAEKMVMQPEQLSLLEKTLLERRKADLSGLSANEQAALLTSRAAIVLPPEELENRLRESKESGTPLIIKFGIDPTGSDVHLGHIAPIIMLNRMQRMGHKVRFVIGDFTASIGDPSGRTTSRPQLTDEEISANASSYLEQVSPFLDLDQANFTKNSTWLNDLTAKELTAIASRIGVAQLLQRDEFQDRLKAGSSLTLAETFYAIYMGIDSVKLESVIEVSGVDQLINLQVCRTVQKIYGQREEVALTCPLLLGTSSDTEKMSKSKKNYIPVRSTPDDLYGKLMSIPDGLGENRFGRIEMFYKALTEITDEEWLRISQQMEIGTLNPMHVKKTLAHLVTSVVYGGELANVAQEKFESMFQGSGQVAVEELPIVRVAKGCSIVDFLIASGVANSKSAAKRLLAEKGVRSMDRQNIYQADDKITNGQVVRVGKRTFVSEIVN